jgi:RND family efflux transporter MFP subunit
MLPIAPKVAGRLHKILADEGATVREGQPLIELDSREPAASVAEWEARVRFSEAQFRRASELFRNRTGTESALDQARNEFDTAKALLERAKRQLAEMILIAPGDGIIIRRDGEVGQLVQPGEPVLWMSCCGSLRVTAEIDEEDISRVKAGQKVLIRADAFPERIFEGTVAEITPKGDPVARSFRVRMALPPQTQLMIGMTVDNNIVIAEKQDAVLVPATAVVDGMVWLVEDGRLVRRAVSRGIIGERMTEITAGLVPGDLVVARPVAGLRDGQRARVVRPVAQ